jgi:hypothetical protein
VGWELPAETGVLAENLSQYHQSYMTSRAVAVGIRRGHILTAVFNKACALLILQNSA